MYYTTISINDHIYQIKDPMGVLTTLIIGKYKAMLIDTAYGLEDLASYIKTITDKPLIVVNSHGHMDHSNGNYLFDEVYIHPLDLDLCIKHNTKEWRIKNIETAKKLNLITESFDEASYINKDHGNLKFIEYNEIFDLGDINVQILNMEGHTRGSIGFLIKEDNILVTSDAACPFVWLFLEESTPVSKYIKMLEKILTYNFDHILVGHGAGKLLPRSKVQEFLDVAKEIDLNKSVKVSFGNFDNLNSYCYTTGVMYNQDHVGVVFDPNKL